MDIINENEEEKESKKMMKKVRRNNKVADKVNRMFIKADIAVQNLSYQVKEMLGDTAGEGFVDTALKILISVVIGALLLGGLYVLFNDTVLPTLTQRIKELFNYKG